MTRVLDPETGEIKLKVNEELTRSLSGGIGLEHKPKPSAEAKDRLIQALDEIEFEALENVSRIPPAALTEDEPIRFAEDDEPVFDESVNNPALYQEILNPDLTEAQIEDAKSLYNMTRGVMIVTGFPGSGKGVFANTLAWKIKRYYKDKKVFRDDAARRPFGYFKLFNEEFIMGEMEAMAKASGTTSEVQKELKTQKAIKDASSLAKAWMANRGQVMLQNGVLMLDEFWRYMHNRRPMNPMGLIIGGILKTWRHLDLLVIGMAPQKRELDAISCLPYITHEVRCSWSLMQPDTTDVRIFKVRYVGAKGVIEATGQPMLIHINGGKERPELCDTCYVRDKRDCLTCNRRYFDLYNSKNISNIKPIKSMDM
jgi:hypothetical protein